MLIWKNRNDYSSHLVNCGLGLTPLADHARKLVKRTRRTLYCNVPRTCTENRTAARAATRAQKTVVGVGKTPDKGTNVDNQARVGQELCPGFQGNSDCHPCECGDHGCCNPGMTPAEALYRAEQDARAIAEWNDPKVICPNGCYDDRHIGCIVPEIYT